MRFVLSIVVLSVLLAGCGPKTVEPTDTGKQTNATTPNAGSNAAAPADWLTHHPKGFTVAMPKDWMVADLTTGDVKDAMKTWENDPKMKELSSMVEQAAAAGQIKLFAFDVPHGDKNFTDNFNVIDQPLPEAPPMKELLRQNVEGIKPIATGESKSEIVNLPGGEAGMIRWGMKRQDGVELGFATYLLIANGKAYTFSFTAVKDRSDAFAASAAEIMKTVKFD